MQTNHPKCSILVPVYNASPYLKECLDSLKYQTLQDIEFICVNDGSTDNSLDILKTYAEGDGRFVIINKENGGYGKAMNVAQERATGEYIGIVEPDDYVDLRMFETLYQVAKEHDADYVKSDFFRFTRTGKDQTTKYYALTPNKEFYNCLLSPQVNPELATFVLNTWNGIYRNKFIVQHSIRYNETPGASFQDNGFFWQTLVRANRVVYLDKPFYYNRRDNPNSSVKSKEKVYCMNEEMGFIERLLKQDELIWNNFSRYFCLSAFQNYVFTFGRIDDCFKKEYATVTGDVLRRYVREGMFDESVFRTGELRKFKLWEREPLDFYYKYGLISGDPRTIEKVLRSVPFKILSKVFKVFGKK